MSAASVVSITELKTGTSATPPSIANANSKEQQQLERAMCKAQDAQAAGTCQLKRKTADSISKIPRYKRGYVWEKSSSPHSLATKTAPPLASPPSHLSNDPKNQSTLHAMHDYIRVETPFNINHFEVMLYNHLNQPFVKSVCTLHSPWLSGWTPVGLRQSGGHPPDSGHLYWTPLDVR